MIQLFETYSNSTLHIMQIIGHPVGGVRKHVHAILLGLDTSCFKQTYVYSNLSGDPRFFEEIPTIQKKLYCEIALKISKKPSVYDFPNIWRLKKYILSEKVDIVHGHGAKGGFYARVLGMLCNIKVVYTPHGGTVHQMFSKAENYIYTFIEKCLFGKTDYFLFESEYTAKSYMKKVGKVPRHWLVNYNGVTEPKPEAYNPRSIGVEYDKGDSETIHIGVFSMLRPEKGQIYAIRAVAELNNRNVKVFLHLFGDGPDRSYLETAASNFEIADQIIFHGDVPDIELHICAMDIILIPSLFESFGYVAVEAFSLKKPVVATRVGGLCEVVDEHTGLFVEPGSVDDIVTRVLDYKENPEIYIQVGRNGFEKYQRLFTEKRMLKKISEVYQDLNAENPSDD